MSKYTTEVRFICEQYAGLVKSSEYTNIDNVINTAMPRIFDFDFPIFDEAYRNVLQRKILNHYYTREIGYEVVARWKLALKNKLNEIMPYYNQLYESELLEFNPLYTHNITKTGSKTGNKTGNKSNQETTQNNITKDNYEDTRHNQTNTSQNTNNNTNYKLHSDTPQGGLQGVDSETYLSDAVKTTDANTGTGTEGISYNHDVSYKADEQNSGTRQGTQNETVNNTDEYLETVVGYENKNPSKSLKDYRETFLNIDMMIINDLSKLFMGVW